MFKYPERCLWTSLFLLEICSAQPKQSWLLLLFICLFICCLEGRVGVSTVTHWARADLWALLPDERTVDWKMQTSGAGCAALPPARGMWGVKAGV